MKMQSKGKYLFINMTDTYSCLTQCHSWRRAHFSSTEPAWKERCLCKACAATLCFPMGSGPHQSFLSRLYCQCLWSYSKDFIFPKNKQTWGHLMLIHIQVVKMYVFLKIWVGGSGRNRIPWAYPEAILQNEKKILCSVNKILTKSGSFVVGSKTQEGIAFNYVYQGSEVIPTVLASPKVTEQHLPWPMIQNLMFQHSSSSIDVQNEGSLRNSHRENQYYQRVFHSHS